MKLQYCHWVYLVSFSSEEFARNCVEMDVQINGILLDKFLLRDYKRKKFLFRQIQKTRSFKLNQNYLMENELKMKVVKSFDSFSEWGFEVLK